MESGILTSMKYFWLGQEPVYKQTNKKSVIYIWSSRYPAHHYVLQWSLVMYAEADLCNTHITILWLVKTHKYYFYSICMLFDGTEEK
jgi:hypothetical protein